MLRAPVRRVLLGERNEFMVPDVVFLIHFSIQFEWVISDFVSLLVFSSYSVFSLLLSAESMKDRWNFGGFEMPFHFFYVCVIRFPQTNLV